MKFSIEVDCTPQEARTFLGLPDVEDFQNEMMATIKSRLGTHLESMDPDAMIRAWLPMGLETITAMQKAFMGMGSSRAPSPAKTSNDD